MNHRTKWERYRDSRRGTYDFRCQTRYKEVREKLLALGLKDGDTVLDVGAGTCQFGRYLEEQGWNGEYFPVDAVLDGTDLENWVVDWEYDFIVSIEVLEHLFEPYRLMRSILRKYRKGVVITTPNCEAVNVIACDPTHVSVVHPDWLSNVGLKVERHSWFGETNDTLLAFCGGCGKNSERSDVVENKRVAVDLTTTENRDVIDGDESEAP